MSELPDMTQEIEALVASLDTGTSTEENKILSAIKSLEGEQTLDSLKTMRAWAPINNFAVFVTYIDKIKTGKNGFKFQV